MPGPHHVATILLAICLTSDSLATKEKVYYMSPERANITYWNPRYIAFANGSATRHGRRDPKYYIHAHIRTLVAFDNNYTVDILFYEFRSNEYRRGFVEMHFRWCDLVLKDFFFGPALRAKGIVCPTPKGEYHMVNASFPELPLLRTFPFRRGRVYWRAARGRERVYAAHVDVEIKQLPARAPPTY